MQSNLVTYIFFYLVTLAFASPHILVAIVGRSEGFELRLMPVQVPDAAGGVTTGDRLARNAAALFGVDWATNERRRTWVCRFDAVTLAEVGRGVPGDFAENPNESSPNEISSATLNRFRPDRKAAAVLIGAEVLFSTLIPTFEDVLATIAGDLNEDLRLAVWAILVHESFRCQPALFAAAVAARGVQRALTKEWAPYVFGPTTPQRAEYQVESSQPSDELVPRTLSLLDATVSEVAQISFHRLRRGSIRYLRDDILNRWNKYLLKSDDRGLAWVVEKDGRRSVDMFSPVLAPVISLVDEFRGRGAAQDVADEAAWVHLLPRIPSAATLNRLSESSRPAVIWAILQLHRILREDPRYDDTSSGGSFFPAVTRGAAELAELSSNSLGADHPLTVWARAKWLNKEISDQRDRNPKGVLESLRLLQQEIGRMREFHLRGLVSSGQFADFISSLSGAVNAVGTDARDRDDLSTANEIHEYVLEMWEWFFSALPFDPRPALTTPANGASIDSPWRHLLAPHLHNYAAALARSVDPNDLEMALRLEEQVVVPARRRISGGDTRLRNALQVVVRILVRSADATNDERDKIEVAEHAWPYLDELLRSSFGKEAIRDARESTEPLRAEQVTTLTAITAGLILAMENGVGDHRVDADAIDQWLERAEASLTMRANPTDSKSSGRLIQVRLQRQRLRAASGRH